jgi:hypothetical protein
MRKPTRPVKCSAPALIDELDTLAAEIRNTHEEAEAEASATRERANRAITAALLCGKALGRAKALVGHGQWLKWLSEHCRAISERTARKYMALANRNHDSVLTADSLRQAYIEAGIISEPEKKQCQESTVSPSTQSSTSNSSEPKSEQPSACSESTSDPTSDSGSTVSGCDNIPEQEQPTFPTLPTDDEHEPFTPDPFAKLRQLVGYVMTEVERLGDGAKGAIVEEVMPVIQWAQERHMI